MGKYNKRPKLRSVKREKARKKDPIRRELKPLEAEEGDLLSTLSHIAVSLRMELLLTQDTRRCQYQ